LIVCLTDFLVVTNVLDDRSWGNRDRTDLHRDVVRVPQREENRARYFLDRHRLPDARFIRLCLDSEVDMVEPGATLVERLARIVRDYLE
jgi:hypothetical protein